MYRLLEEGETIESGDEWYEHGGWERCIYTIGKTVSYRHAPYRRKMEEEPVVLNPGDEVMWKGKRMLLEGSFSSGANKYRNYVEITLLDLPTPSPRKEELLGALKTLTNKAQELVRDLEDAE